LKSRKENSNWEKRKVSESTQFFNFLVLIRWVTKAPISLPLCAAAVRSSQIIITNNN
jgi:hypothetical protein